MSLEQFGDRWSLLMIRDMMVRGYHTFKEFQESGEGISSNVVRGSVRCYCADGKLPRTGHRRNAKKMARAGFKALDSSL
jgi:DNA-binding HxlR family transcriptional regulator